MTPEVLALRRTQADAVEIDLALPPEHAAFAGHFPGRPILPGVVQLDWAVRLAASSFGQEFRPVRRFRVKYMQVIPPMPAGLSVSIRLDRTRRELDFAYQVGAVTASTGRIWLDS